MSMEIIVTDELYHRLCGLAIKARIPVEDLAEKMLEKRATELEKEWERLDRKSLIGGAALLDVKFESMEVANKISKREQTALSAAARRYTEIKELEKQNDK